MKIACDWSNSGNVNTQTHTENEWNQRENTSHANTTSNIYHRQFRCHQDMVLVLY